MVSILVVEGPQCCGKTTWVHQLSSSAIVVDAPWADEYSPDALFASWVSDVKRALASSSRGDKQIVCDTGPLAIKQFFPNWTIPPVPFTYETRVLAVATTTLWERVCTRALRESTEDPETHIARIACGENSRESLEKAVAFFEKN